MRIVDGHDRLTAELVQAACRSPRGRAARVFHKMNPDGTTSAATTQHLINVMLPGTYVAPHRYPGWQHIVVLEGLFLLLIYRKDSTLDEAVHMHPGDVFVVEPDDEVYHAWLVLEGPSAIYESRPGPYNGRGDCQFLPGFPREDPKGDAEVLAVHNQLDAWEALVRR